MYFHVTFIVRSEDKVPAELSRKVIHWATTWKKAMALHGAFLSQGQEGTQSLEKVTLFGSLFSMAAWTDLIMS